MSMIKQLLRFILILAFLDGCTQPAAHVNLAPELTPALVKTATPAPPDIGAPSSTTAPEIKVNIDHGTNSATLLPTDTGMVLSPSTPPVACQPEPIIQPPKPVKTFQSNELDPETGLHVTGLVQWIDLATYRLNVTGLVDHPLSLTYDDLRCLPKVTANPDLICLGVFVDKATWTGVPIKDILELAGVQESATELTFVSADGYQVNLPLVTASADENFLAYEVNGKPLPVQHGFPLRAVFPYMWGSEWIKWLVEIRIS